jgi:hypothetical protein
MDLEKTNKKDKTKEYFLRSMSMRKDKTKKYYYSVAGRFNTPKIDDIPPTVSITGTVPFMTVRAVLFSFFKNYWTSWDSSLYDGTCG